MYKNSKWPLIATHYLINPALVVTVKLSVYSSFLRDYKLSKAQLRLKRYILVLRSIIALNSTGLFLIFLGI